MKILELDPKVLGNRVLGIVPASSKGKLSCPKTTVVGSLHDFSVPEEEFFYDLFNSSTSELVDKWYGGLV